MIGQLLRGRGRDAQDDQGLRGRATVGRDVGLIKVCNKQQPGNWTKSLG